MSSAERQAVIDKVAEVLHSTETFIADDGHPVLRLLTDRELAAAVVDALSCEDLLALLGAERLPGHGDDPNTDYLCAAHSEGQVCCADGDWVYRIIPEGWR